MRAASASVKLWPWSCSKFADNNWENNEGHSFKMPKHMDNLAAQEDRKKMDFSGLISFAKVERKLF